MRIHLIAIGGAVMHNLAIALSRSGNVVTGSDDEIYNPSHDRLKEHGLLPDAWGWHPDRIHNKLDVVILGMHARKDNPELQRALELGLEVLSYPEFVYQASKDKQRLAVVGSHGKTTTTAMVMHALRFHNVAFDYLVGAQLEGFDQMVSLTDAPVIVLEGDEYLSSPLDPTPKMLRYRPHSAALTGIAWDHINVFPTFEAYLDAFAQLPAHMENGGKLFYPKEEKHFQAIRAGIKKPNNIDFLPYEAYPHRVEKGITKLLQDGKSDLPLQIFGAHNLQNARAAALLCTEAGLSEAQFLEALTTFKGAGKRLQLLGKSHDRMAWLDFAHAPSKVRATTLAVSAQYPHRRLIAGVELHTFSSLNKAFLPGYKDSLSAAEAAFVFYDPATLEHKRMPSLDANFIKKCFGHRNLTVLTSAAELDARLEEIDWHNTNLLIMSSGKLGGWDVADRIPKIMGLEIV